MRLTRRSGGQGGGVLHLESKERHQRRWQDALSLDLVPISNLLCPPMGPVSLGPDSQWDLHYWSLICTVAPCHLESPPLEEPWHSRL